MTRDTHAEFETKTRVDEARGTLLELVPCHRRTETAGLENADGRVLATALDAERNVPHYPRAAMDGYAVRAEDTFDADDRSPVSLKQSEGEVQEGEAAWVHTGSEIPDGADAVVMVEKTREFDDAVEVFGSVSPGENVAPEGEDVDKDTTLYEGGHRLRPSDLALLKSTGVEEVEVFERPRVAVLPTGEELVERGDPEPGEVVETNGLMVSRYVERWGGEPLYRDIVPDDADELRDALERDLDADIIVTTGGSSVGKRDVLPDVIEEMKGGEIHVHGVAIKPGHPVGIARVESTPIVMLPGYPVSSIVNAVQFLRPAVAESGGASPTEHPGREARLEGKIVSEVGVRTFARVSLDSDGDELVATPTRASGAGVLSSAALSDGWIEVPENREGIPAGETVEVQYWEPPP